MYLVTRWFAPTAGLALCSVLPAGPSAAAETPGGTVAAAAMAPRREMSTDRPDSTESPYTVEPGFAQLEMSFASREQDRDDGVRTTAWAAAPFNLRVGMTRDFEAGLMFVPWQRVIERSADGTRTARDGVGDVSVRGKWNLRGNDDPGPGVGLMLDVTFPTAPRQFGPRKVEAAATVPVAFEMGGGWSGGAMTSLQLGRNEQGARRPQFFNTLTAGRDLARGFGAFVELASLSGQGPHILTFNGGLTHAVHADLQLDAGVNVGVSNAAPDVLWFAGVSRRF